MSFFACQSHSVVSSELCAAQTKFQPPLLYQCGERNLIERYLKTSADKTWTVCTATPLCLSKKICILSPGRTLQKQT